MAWSVEDKSWLEQRLEQHKRDIQAQLDQHFSKIALDVGPGQNRVESTPIFIPTRKAPAKRGDLANEREGQDAEGSRSKTPTKTPTNTPLHYLMVDETEHVIHQPSIRGRVSTFLTTVMSHFINFCVVANTITMFVELQWFGSKANAVLENRSHTGWSNADIIWQVLEYTFAIIFLLDLVLQLYAFRLQYFKSQFNILNSIVVVITSLEVFVLTPLASSLGNVSVVRLLRLAKFARAFKAARTFKSVEGLRVLVEVMCCSLSSTFWSLIILFVFQLMGSIFMCHSLHDFVRDDSKDLALRIWVNSMYGDGVKSLWTIFELTFSGCWPNYARRIIEEVNPLYSWFYLLYVYLVVFVTTRIVSAIFIKETLTTYSKEAETMVKERAKKSSWIRQSLSDLFQEADANQDGILSEDELHELFRHPKVKLGWTQVTRTCSLNSWMKEMGGW